MSEEDCNLIQSNANQELSAEAFWGKIVLSVSLKDFSARTLEEFKPDILLKDGDSLSGYGVNADIIALTVVSEEMDFSGHFCYKNIRNQHRAGMNFANKYNPSSPAFTSCGMPAGKTEITPGS